MQQTPFHDKFADRTINNGFGTTANQTVLRDPSNEPENDPISIYLSYVNKLTYIANNMPRNNLDKDIRLIQVEAFHHKLFGREA